MATPRSPQFMQGITLLKSNAQPTADSVRPAPWSTSPRPVVAAPAPAPSPAVPPPSEHDGFESIPPLAPPSMPMPTMAPLAPPPVVVHELSPKAEAAIRTLRAEGARLAEQARADALEVGLLVARTILEREVTQSFDALFSLIKSAIRRIGEARRVIVKLHPDDAVRMNESADAVLTLAHVEIVADDSLEPGDVMVDTEHHTIDARIATRLEETRQELMKAVRAQP